MDHERIVDILEVSDAQLLDGSFRTTGVTRIDYNTDDEDSLSSSQILSEQVTNPEPKDVITWLQSIEMTELLLLELDLKKAYLVSDNELKKRHKAGLADSTDDSNNNRIVLTTSLRRLFD